MGMVEAVEEVLRGPYKDCEPCKGTGQVYMEGGRGTVGTTPTDCSICRGSGKGRRAAYLEACIVLNKEPVPVPRRERAEVIFFGTPGGSKSWTHLTYEERLIRSTSSEANEQTFRKEYMGEWVKGTDWGSEDDERRSRRDYFEGEEDEQVPAVRSEDEAAHGHVQQKLRKL